MWEGELTVENSELGGKNRSMHIIMPGPEIEMPTKL